MSLLIYLKVKLFELLEQKKVERTFYWKESFKNADQTLLKAYQFECPYKICKDFLKRQKAAEVFAYGETPLTTMDTIVQQCGLTSADTLIEMGAGRGRTSLFLAEYVGCQVIAYEQIPTFIEKIPHISNLKMVTQDMFSADFAEAKAIYLYGTMLSESEIVALSEAFPKNVKIITVSYPLSNYSQKYVTRKIFPGRFPWGKTEVYWNERIS